MADKKLLIVEDSIDIQLLLASLLRGEGYTVDCCSCGRDALEYLQKEKVLPSLILLDLMMPDMDGFEFSVFQKKDPRISGIPLVVMTADSNIDAKAAQIGAQGQLKKPFSDVSTILNTVARFFP